MTNEEAMVLIKKNPISFGCGALSFVLAIGLYLRSEAMPDAEAALIQKTAAGERIALNIKYSAQLKEQLETLTNAGREIDKRVIRSSQLGTNTQYFYKVEADTGVKILDLRQTTPAVSTRPAKASFLPVGFAVTAQGTMTQLLQFLRELENGAHYSRILSASCVGSPSARNAPVTLTLSLELLGQP
ncbi:hypothetical protein [Horticoccus sp. 23ND18S-11]|uniref:hypothetical protein n=1 Tax=Horticoccus sp. 23ND18S-11 TaxID=3391832 RepID=UPI0039C910E5